MSPCDGEQGGQGGDFANAVSLVSDTSPQSASVSLQLCQCTSYTSHTGPVPLGLPFSSTETQSHLSSVVRTRGVEKWEKPVGVRLVVLTATGRGRRIMLR